MSGKVETWTRMAIARRLERERAIVLARNSGMVWRAIGKAQGVSGPRAKNIYDRAMAQKALAGTPAGELTARLRNALRNHGCEVTPAAVRAKFTMHDLERMVNVGTTCIAELQAWLVRHGQEPIA
jgi:hypothetical protein